MRLMDKSNNLQVTLPNNLLVLIGAHLNKGKRKICAISVAKKKFSSVKSDFVLKLSVKEKLF